MSRLTANLFMNSNFDENLENLKNILKNRAVWRAVDRAYEEALCEIAGRAKMGSLVSSKLFLKYNYGIEVRSSKPLKPSQRALFINDKLYTIIDTTPADAIIVTKGLLWIGILEVATRDDYQPGIWKTNIPNLRYQLLRVAGFDSFSKATLVKLAKALGSTIRFEVVNPNSPRRIVVVKEISISEIGRLETFITDPNEDIWEIKKAKEDYYIKKLADLETGSFIKGATAWFDNKSLALSTFKAKSLGQVLLTCPFEVYIKRSETQVDKLNTCNMSVTSYTITYK